MDTISTSIEEVGKSTNWFSMRAVSSTEEKECPGEALEANILIPWGRQVRCNLYKKAKLKG